MNSLNRLQVAAILLTGLSSCQKIVSLKLNNTAPQYVIEGEITDGPGPYYVNISRTRNFSANNNFEQITGAEITITDQQSGITDTLSETTGGAYVTRRISGVPGHTYKLHVGVNGQLFTALATMPVQPVPVTRLLARKSDLGTDDVFMAPEFTDPLGKGNYYRMRQWVRGLLVKGSVVRSDEAIDGFTYRTQLFYDTNGEAANPIIHHSDTITAELQCVSKAVYDYYRTLQDATGENSATPANPLTNLTGGALGVFNACISRKKGTIAIY